VTQQRTRYSDTSHTKFSITYRESQVAEAAKIKKQYPFHRGDITIFDREGGDGVV
jgi:hypothetical protein